MLAVSKGGERSVDVNVPSSLAYSNLHVYVTQFITKSQCSCACMESKQIAQNYLDWVQTNIL